jgi:hypothetical protein
VHVDEEGEANCVNEADRVEVDKVETVPSTTLIELERDGD